MIIGRELIGLKDVGKVKDIHSNVKILSTR